jgi:hypothetical protein
MVKTYGKEHLLNDPDKQIEMLKNRKISGVYEWSYGNYKFNYTGSYELKFLQFLDLFMNWNPLDIIAPAPMIFNYKDVDGTGPIKACPIGITFGDLATNESCYISMNAPDVSFFNSGLLDENLPLEFAGEVNYDDSELGFVVSNDSSKLLPFDQLVSGNWVNINVSNVTDTIGEETFNVNGTSVTANLRKVDLTVELDGIKANIANLGNLEVLPVVGISGIAAPVAAPIAKVDGATARVTAYLPISTTSQVIELKLINKANGSVVRSVKHTLSNFISTVRAQ